MKNKITLTSNHPNATRAQYFLNSLGEELTEIPLNRQDLKLSEFVEDGFRFSGSTEDPVTITVLLCDSYSNASKVAEANGFTLLPSAMWSVNGDMLYFIESQDAEKVSTILGIFAGDE